MKKLLYLALVSCAVLLLGCGASRDTIEPAETDNPAAGLPTLAELDALPQPAANSGAVAAARQASSTYMRIWLAEPLVMSKHAVLDAGSVRLLASGGEMEYMIQRVDPSWMRVVKLTMATRVSAGNGYYGLANFATGRWELHQLDDADHPEFPADFTDYRSPSGMLYYCVLAFGGSDVYSDGCNLKFMPGDPIVTTVTTMGSNTTDTRIVEYNNKPAIFFKDTADDLLKMAWTDTDTPADPADWHIAPMSEEIQGYRMMDVVEHKGRLHVAYTAPGQMRIAVLEGDPADGVSAWTKHVADNGIEVGIHAYRPSLLSLDGRLHLLHMHSDSQDYDDDNAYSTTFYTVFDDDFDGEKYELFKSYTKAVPTPSLSVVNGRPAIAWADGTDGGLWYAAAWNTNPKDGEWDIMQLASDSADDSEVKLLELNGCPTILHLLPGILEFSVTRSTVPYPLDSSSWVTHNWGVRATQGELMATRAYNYPVFMWPNYDGQNERLRFSRGYTYELDNPLSPGAYTVDAPDVDGTFYSWHMSLVNGEPVACGLLNDVAGPLQLQFMRLSYTE